MKLILLLISLSAFTKANPTNTTLPVELKDYERCHLTFFYGYLEIKCMDLQKNIKKTSVNLKSVKNPFDEKIMFISEEMNDLGFNNISCYGLDTKVTCIYVKKGR